MKLKYNLQFFAEGDNNGDSSGSSNSNQPDTNNNSNSSDDTKEPTEIDPSAFADIISEKDKQIQQLQNDVNELKKSNALLTVRVNAGQKPVEFDTEKAILAFCDTRKVN